MILCDLDDLAEDDRSHADMERLFAIKEAVPTFKATLFTIPGRCSAMYIHNIKRDFPWLDLVAHGWNHNSNYECLHWTKQQCKDALARARDIGITTKGFKAPGWQISDGCYDALLEEGYWVADQFRNEPRRPFGLKFYDLCDSGATVGGGDNLAVNLEARVIHGHIGHLGGHNANALEFIMPQILEAAKTDSDFRFISEVIA